MNEASGEEDDAEDVKQDQGRFHFDAAFRFPGFGNGEDDEIDDEIGLDEKFDDA